MAISPISLIDKENHIKEIQQKELKERDDLKQVDLPLLEHEEGIEKTSLQHESN